MSKESTCISIVFVHLAISCEKRYQCCTLEDCSFCEGFCKVCSNHWCTYNGKSCFISDKVTLNFTDAKKFCANHSSSLVHIHDQEEDDFIVGQARKTEHYSRATGFIHFWIGLTDLDHYTVYRWLDDNTTASYTDWYVTCTIREPTGGNEHCAVIDVGKYDFKWNNQNCDLHFSPVCVKSINAHRVNNITVPPRNQANSKLTNCLIKLSWKNHGPFVCQSKNFYNTAHTINVQNGSVVIWAVVLKSCSFKFKPSRLVQFLVE